MENTQLFKKIYCGEIQTISHDFVMKSAQFSLLSSKYSMSSSPLERAAAAFFAPTPALTPPLTPKFRPKSALRPAPVP